MALDVVTTPSQDDATKLNDYTRLRDNDRIAAVPTIAGAALLLGGSHDDYEYGTAFARLPRGPAFEIDGALQGYVSIYLEVDAVREPAASSTVSAVFDLYNATDGAVVAGSEVTVSVDVAHPTSKHGKSTTFTLNTGVKRYYFRLKSGTINVGVGGFCKLVAKGS